ncbi:apoptosis-enhancing nuclease-like [Heptranchias perlo]|uniref:apoptosis-enhancing nuclease-like n=1 Tax=Heptranchias perlo TaxID=212740 RepID=UPI003559580D
MPSVADARVDLASPAARRRFHGFSSSAQFLGCTPGSTPGPGCSDSRSGKRKKKPSRRHERFRERKAFLEREGILKKRRFKGKEGLADRPRRPRSKKPNCTVQSRKAERPCRSDVDGNHSTLSGVPQPKVENGHPTIFPKSASKRDPPAQMADALALANPGELSLAAAAVTPRPVSPPSFCRKAAKCVAIDCEMVGTGPGGRLGEVARCSIVNYQGDVVYDKYVKPGLPIADYRTRWSGIRKQHMASAIVFSVAQREILKILKGKIVVGHALHNDFKALKYFHPKSLTRDTSRIPMLKRKAGFPERESVSLKNLAKQLLHKNIQVGRDGHCSVEDACTSMELYRLVEIPWEQKLCSQLSAEQEHTASETNSDVNHYMDDRYWPADLQEDSK